MFIFPMVIFVTILLRWSQGVIKDVKGKDIKFLSQDVRLTKFIDA